MGTLYTITSYYGNIVTTLTWRQASSPVLIVSEFPSSVWKLVLNLETSMSIGVTEPSGEKMLGLLIGALLL